MSFVKLPVLLTVHPPAWNRAAASEANPVRVVLLSTTSGIAFAEVVESALVVGLLAAGLVAVEPLAEALGVADPAAFAAAVLTCVLVTTVGDAA